MCKPSFKIISINNYEWHREHIIKRRVWIMQCLTHKHIARQKHRQWHSMSLPVRLLQPILRPLLWGGDRETARPETTLETTHLRGRWSRRRPPSANQTRTARTWGPGPSQTPSISPRASWVCCRRMLRRGQWAQLSPGTCSGWSPTTPWSWQVGVLDESRPGWERRRR